MFSSTRKLLAYERGMSWTSWSWRVLIRDDRPCARTFTSFKLLRRSHCSYSTNNHLDSPFIPCRRIASVLASPKTVQPALALSFRCFTADASTPTTTSSTSQDEPMDSKDAAADVDDLNDASGFDSLLQQLGAANSKNYEPVEEITPEKLEKVAERLRFFLSDANLRKDAFFRNFMFQNNKTIPVGTILRCNSVKLITQSPEVVIRAAQDLCSDFLFVSDKVMTDVPTEYSLMNAGIGRIEPFTAEKMEEYIPLTLYLGNLPYDDRYYATQQDIRDLFPDIEISVVNFRFRRPSLKDEYKGKNKKIPVGCCLVEFKNLEDVEKLAEDLLTMNANGDPLKPSKTLKIGDNELEVMRLKDYSELRQKQKEDGLYPFRPNTY